MQMSQRRFFVLSETCPVSEMESMLGRAVTDKLMPLSNFAPREPLHGTAEARHNPQDILPNILPEPSLSVERKEILSRLRDNKLGLSLQSLFAINLARSTEERLQLESQIVKRYSLNNAKQVFEELMKNDLYARDVKALLSQTTLGRGYFIVGFLTTTGTNWTSSSSISNSAGTDVTIPAAALGGIPIVGLGDPGVNTSVSSTTGHKREMQVANEEIFAVAYNVIKTSYNIDRIAPGYVKKVPVIGPSKRASARYLSLGNDSEEEDVEIEDETEENGEGIQVVFQTNDDELTRSEFSDQRSFTLE